MSGLDPNMVSHAFNTQFDIKPVKQQRLNLHSEMEIQIKKEVEKLIEAGFIKPIQHPT